MKTFFINLLHCLNKKYNTLTIQARSSFWFVICSFFQKGISLVTVPIFTRVLTVEEFGITSLFSAWATLLSIFATLNLSGGVYNRGLLSFDEKKFTSSIQILSTSCALCVSLVILIFNKSLSVYTGLDTSLLLLLCPYFVFISGINFWVVKERFYFRYRTLVIVTILNTLVSTGLGLGAVLLASQDKGNQKVIWSTLGLIVVAAPIYFKNLIEGKTFYQREMWKFSLSFNLPLLPHYLSNIVLNQSDRIMINYFCGLASVALYSVAFSIASISKVFLDAISSSLIPWRYQALESKKYEEINRISISILAVVGFFVGVINLFAPEILLIFGNTRYMEAVWCIPPVMLSMYFIFLYSMFSNIEFYFLKTKFMMIASGLSSILNIMLNYLFIRTYGYLACAYTSLFCYMVYCYGHYVYMKHICKKQIPDITIYNSKLIVIITVSTIVFTICSTFLYNYFVIRYSIIFLLIVFCIIFKSKILCQVKRFRSYKYF